MEIMDDSKFLLILWVLFFSVSALSSLRAPTRHPGLKILQKVNPYFWAVGVTKKSQGNPDDFLRRGEPCLARKTQTPDRFAVTSFYKGGWIATSFAKANFALK
jgi:hypothetical protein